MEETIFDNMGNVMGAVDALIEATGCKLHDVEYEVEVVETLRRVVKVKMPVGSYDKALAEVKRRYRSSEIVLDERDYVGVEFRVLDDDED